MSHTKQQTKETVTPIVTFLITHGFAKTKKQASLALSIFCIAAIISTFALLKTSYVPFASVDNVLSASTK